MSTSPIARQVTQSQSIPPKRILIHDPNEMPIDYSSTPGGTIYSTTPGGTRIVYERTFLMNLKNSPISRTPPRNIPTIPAELLIGTPTLAQTIPNTYSKPTENIAVIEETSEQFEMDI